MQTSTVLTAGGAQASTTAPIEQSPSLTSNTSSKFDDELSSQQPRTKMTSENRPPNLPDDDNDDNLSFDDEEELEQQMLLSPSYNSHDDAMDDEEEELAAQLEDLYNQEEQGGGQGGSGAEGGDPHSSDADGNEKVMNNKHTIVWICICFFGIMFSFVAYGLLLEYATSGGRKLHELSFLFVTSLLYTCTAAAGRYVRDEKPSTIPPARFAVLGMTSMGSTFCSVRSLRYVIFPIQVLAKSCKPVPVMIMGALMGKKYPLRKYLNVCLIVFGVGLFMGGGSSQKKQAAATDDESSSSMQVFGIILLFISLCFDGGTGAYEDKLMAVHHVGPFDLMYNIQLGKTIIAGVALLVLNQVHVFMQMCQDMGFVLVALGLTGAMGQVFIFVTIAKFGALTCSIIGLSRKVTTLVASIYIYGHALNAVQATGLVISVGAMVMNFWGKKGNKSGHGHGGHGGGGKEELPTVHYSDNAGTQNVGDVELPAKKVHTLTAGGGR